MKVLRVKSLIVAALALSFSACEKSTENIKDVSELKAASTAKVVYPLVGTDTSGHILPMRKLPGAVLTYHAPDLKVQIIDTICADYLNETEKIDLAYLAEGSVTYVIRTPHNILTADPEGFNGGFKKLSSGPNGWWTHWNYSPYTESQNPIVLFAVNWREPKLSPWSSMGISFRDPVKTLGFEIAPNASGKDIKIRATYNDAGSYRGQTMFSLEQTISSPSGARLIAVKSNVPFNYVLIELLDAPYPAEGFAIANIRYTLAH